LKHFQQDADAIIPRQIRVKYAVVASKMARFDLDWITGFYIIEIDITRKVNLIDFPANRMQDHIGNESRLNSVFDQSRSTWKPLQIWEANFIQVNMHK